MAHPDGCRYPFSSVKIQSWVRAVSKFLEDLSCISAPTEKEPGVVLCALIPARGPSRQRLIYLVSSRPVRDLV